MKTGDGGRASSAPQRSILPALCALLTLSACHASPAPTAVPPTPNAIRVGQLQQTIDNILSEPALARGMWGVSIRAIERDETLYRQNGQKLMMPGSTLKIVTLARVAERLGWDYRYRTELETVGTVVDGTLKGHVVVRGSGDPTLDDWAGSATALFNEWAGRLTAEGITRIDGSIIGDDDAFEDNEPGEGWAWDDLSAGYSAVVSGLQFNENVAQLLMTPASSEGGPATFELRPAFAPVTLDNQTLSAAVDPEFLRIRPDALTIRPALRTPVTEVHGLVPFSGGTIVRNVAVSNPTLYFVTALRSALLNNGIDVVGPAVDADDRQPEFDRSAIRIIAEHQSAPLSDIARTMMKVSQNLFAETLLKTGVYSGFAGNSGTGLEDIVRVLPDWGIAPTDLRMVDGSGLSRYNLITADALLAVLTHVWRDDRLRDRFLDTLPVAGVDGTLANRLRDTAAAGNARAKSGSFSNARALAGFVQTADGEMVAFSILANNYGVSPALVDKATDAVVNALAQFTRH